MEPFRPVPGLPGLGPTALRYLLATALLMMVFALWPEIDLAVSGWFYRAGEGFPLDRAPWARSLRMGLWNLSIALVLAAMVGLVASFLLPAFRGWRGRFGAVVLGATLGPGLLVNGLLKAHWGRARPTQIVEFGGSAEFTQPFRIAGTCLKNCSFVSGEASGAVMTALALGLILRPICGARLWPVVVALLVALAATGALLRVAMGGHFLSDVLFAALFTVALAQFSIWLLMRR